MFKVFITAKIKESEVVLPYQYRGKHLGKQGEKHPSQGGTAFLWQWQYYWVPIWVPSILHTEST